MKLSEWYSNQQKDLKRSFLTKNIDGYIQHVLEEYEAWEEWTKEMKQ